MTYQSVVEKDEYGSVVGSYRLSTIDVLRVSRCNQLQRQGVVKLLSNVQVRAPEENLVSFGLVFPYVIFFFSLSTRNSLLVHQPFSFISFGLFSVF